MLNLFLAVVRRDLMLALRQKSDIIQTLFFFAVVITLVPLGVGAEQNLLRTMAPGVVWVAALLAALLSLPRIFALDHADGTLEQMVISAEPLTIIVLAKVFAHWLTTGVPITVFTALFGVMFDLPIDQCVVLMASLLLGTPVLSLVGAIGAALTLGLRAGSVLTSLLVLPLYIPVLIFGAGATVQVAISVSPTAYLMVTAAFGQLLSQENLDVPRLGCINVHGSLLPKYRGAAPIQWAIIDGERVTGITTMMTDIGMDTGDILLKAETAIGPDETAGELYDRLAVIGARVLLDTLAALQAGTLRRTPQDEALATKCCMLKKEHGKLDFQQTAQQVHDRVRGVNPWPGAYALLDDGSTLKIWKTQKAGPQSAAYPAGTCFGDARTGLFVQCADGAVELLEVQAAGGKRLDGHTFLRGRPIAGHTLS